MNNKKVSIIVPVYNIQGFIGRCIDSIIHQTYPYIEILIIDDGSTDYSGNICDSYKSKDKRIKVIHKKNGGLSSARNIGLDIAKGDFIMFIDGDDFIDKRTVFEAVELQNKYNADLVIFGINYVNEKGKNVKGFKNQIPSNKILNKKQFWQDFYNYSVFYAVAWNKLYKKKLFKNLRYKKNILFEDDFIIHKIIDICNIIVCLHNTYYYYTQRSDSITKSENSLNKALRFMYRYEIMYLRLQYLLKNKIYSAIDGTCAALFGYLSKLNIKNMKKNEIKKFKCINKKIKSLFIKHLFTLLFRQKSKKNKLIILLFCIFPYFAIKLDSIIV